MILAPTILLDPLVSVSEAELSLSRREDADEVCGRGSGALLLVDWGRYRCRGNGLSGPTRDPGLPPRSLGPPPRPPPDSRLPVYEDIPGWPMRLESETGMLGALR